MKKRKSLMLAIVLLLLVVTGGVTLLTYSRYLSSATGKSTVKVAPWKITVNDADIVNGDEFTVKDIRWKDNEYVADGYIAPGSEGTFDIKIDASGSKVAVEYEVEVGSVEIGNGLTNNGITIVSVKNGETPLEAETDGKYKGIIELADVEEAITLTVTIQWNPNVSDENDTNLGKEAAKESGLNISIPVKVTAKQYLG